MLLQPKRQILKRNCQAYFRSMFYIGPKWLHTCGMWIYSDTSWAAHRIKKLVIRPTRNIWKKFLCIFLIYVLYEPCYPSIFAFSAALPSFYFANWSNVCSLFCQNYQACLSVSEMRKLSDTVIWNWQKLVTFRNPLNFEQ